MGMRILLMCDFIQPEVRSNDPKMIVGDRNSYRKMRIFINSQLKRPAPTRRFSNAIDAHQPRLCQFVQILMYSWHTEIEAVRNLLLRTSGCLVNILINLVPGQATPFGRRKRKLFHI